MRAAQNSIFRDKALKHYTRQKKRDILPNFSSVPVAIFLWMLLGSLLATGLVTWHTQVPVYLTGTSVVLGPAPQGAVALAFLAPPTSTRLHAGLPVSVQTGTSAVQFSSTIATVEPGTTSLANAFMHARLPVGRGPQMQQAVVIMLLARSPALLQERGALLILRVTLGTRSLFAAISGIDS
ncbi:MAG TPA: hypothetical protein VGF67_32610 [Ktedonobacteraceae bacterium]|jgi:hypothetical protein